MIYYLRRIKPFIVLSDNNTRAVKSSYNSLCEKCIQGVKMKLWRLLMIFLCTDTKKLWTIENQEDY